MVAVGLPCGGCLACNDCTIASDTFDRADNADPNDGAPFSWGGITGDMVILDNELLIYSGTPEQLTCPTSHPDGSSSGVVEAVFRADIDDECEVWLGTDADNCIVARVVIGSSKTLKIIQRSAGSDTDLESVTCSTSAYGSIGLTLYYDEVTGIARAVAVATAVCAYTAESTGDLSGVSIGSNGGGVYVSSFSFIRLGDGENGCPVIEDCGYNPCIPIIDSDWEGVLTISGVANNSCTGCGILNGTFVLPLTFNAVNGKTWETFEVDMPTICGSTTLVTMWIDLDCLVDGTYRLEVVVRVDPGGGGFVTQGVWRYSFASEPDLYATYPFALFTPIFVGGSSWCNFSGLTFSVSFNPP